MALEEISKEEESRPLGLEFFVQKYSAAHFTVPLRRAHCSAAHTSSSEENRYRPAPVYDNSYRTKETPKVYTDMRPPIQFKRQPQKSPAVAKRIVATPRKKVFHASVPTKKVVRAPSIVKKVVRAPSVAKRVVKAPAVVKKAVQQRTPVKQVVIPQTAVKKAVQSSKAVKQVAQSPKAVKQVAQSPTAVKQAVPAPAAVKNPGKAQPVSKIQEKLVAKESDVKLGIAVKQAVPAPAAVKNLEKAPPVDKIQEKVEIATKEPDVKLGNVTDKHEDSKVEQRYELSPVMSRALEAELQQIMIKVWQQLPDTTTSAADSLLVDKLRNDAGDALRNVLGLNVTKRILNIHNTLLVKVALLSRPDHGLWMKAFVINFRIVKYKYAQDRKTLFTAQLARIEDFDRLCHADGSRYGGVKLRVTPVYNFTKCPEKIKMKTILSTEEEKKLAKEKQSTDKIGEKSNNQQTKHKVETNIEPKSAANNAVIGTRNASENKKPVQTVEVKEIAPKNTGTVDTAVKSDKTVPGKIANTSKSDTSVKTVPAKTANTSKPDTTAKAVPAKTANTSKPDNTVKAVPAKTANTSKPDTTVKTIPAKTANTNKPNTTAKTIPAKPTNTNNPDTTSKTIPAKVCNTGKPDTPVKTDKPDPAETANTSKPDFAVKTGKNAPANTAAKTDTNAPAKTANSNKPKNVLKTENNKSKETPTKGIATNDNKKDSNENSHTKNTEEPMDIDPNDFLAMMEQGIVLDECTGSDDE